MVHRMVEAMSQLQEEKARLQEELAALQERLALQDSDQQATSTQLQNQVLGRMGWAEAAAYCGAGWRTLLGAPGTNPPGHLA